jgi:phenylacetate-CoA ligase
MQAAQWLPMQELQRRSEARLAPLLAHAARHVPFYRELYRQLNLQPDALQSIADLQRLPVMGKAHYRARPHEQFFAENIPAHRRLDRSTSGSTGDPFQFALDRETVPRIFASHLFYDSWWDLRPFDRYVRIVAPPAVSPPIQDSAPATFKLRQALTRRLQLLYEGMTQRKVTVWDIHPDRAVEIWRSLQRFRPRFVLGYTSTLATLADLLLQEGLRLSHPVRGVITIAETLTPTRRRSIEAYFQAPIINRYGLRELGAWSAQNCDRAPDRFHINTELVVCEIVRDDGSHAAEGETGRVVLTDLYNYARPFIRYDTGDLAVQSSHPCPCGRGFPLLGELQGRLAESVRSPDGKIISPAILGHYLFVYHGHQDVVREYQLIQEAPDRARLLVVPAEGWDETRRVQLRTCLGRLLGPQMEVAVESVPAIPLERSGKRPIIKRAQSRTIAEDAQR